MPPDMEQGNKFSQWKIRNKRISEEKWKTASSEEMLYKFDKYNKENIIQNQKVKSWLLGLWMLKNGTLIQYLPQQENV